MCLFCDPTRLVGALPITLVCVFVFVCLFLCLVVLVCCLCGFVALCCCVV